MSATPYRRGFGWLRFRALRYPFLILMIPAYVLWWIGRGITEPDGFWAEWKLVWRGGV